MAHPSLNTWDADPSEGIHGGAPAAPFLLRALGHSCFPLPFGPFECYLAAAVAPAKEAFMTTAAKSWSSVARKWAVALTGIALVLFLLLHLSGNLLLLLGDDRFDEYAHGLVSNPLIYPAEAGLIVIFLLHAYNAIVHVLRGRAARPQGYVKKAWAGHTSRKSLASTTMALSGLAILLFVPLHVAKFKFGVFGEPPPRPDGMRNLSALVAQTFQHPAWVSFYVVMMGIVGLHLSHGVASSLQSLGVAHSNWTWWNRCVQRVGRGLALLIAIGFALIPLAIFLGLVP